MKPIIAIILFLFATLAHGQRYIDTDYVRNTSRTVVLSLPSTSSTIVGTSATQTLTNKTLEGGTVSGSTLAGALSLTGILSGGTISGTTIAGGSFSGVDNSFILKDNGDNTKQLMFEVSGVTAGNVRTLTVPDWSGTLVTAATSQTLENKSVSAPSIINYMNWGNTGTVPTPAANNANMYYSGSSMRFVNSGGTTYRFTLNEGTNNFTGSNTFNSGVGFNGEVSAAGGINISGGNPGVSPTSGVTLYNPGTNQLAFKGIANVQQILASSEAANQFNQGFSASQTVTINGTTVTVSGTSVALKNATLSNGTTLSQTVSGTWTQGGVATATGGAKLSGFILENVTTSGTWNGYSAVVSGSSTSVTPSGTTQWHQGAGNSLTLPAGRWMLTGVCNFTNGGSSPAYTDYACYWAAANGANSSSVPMSLTVKAGFTDLSAGIINMYGTVGSVGTIVIPAATTFLRVTDVSGTATVFLNTWSQQTTSSNARTNVHMNAYRLP